MWLDDIEVDVKYAYEDLSDDQFEELIVLLCQELLGIAVQGFSKGPDGGRDAKFVGKAELHPSKASPWIGTTIIQAKHTNGINKYFNDSDFFSKTSQSTIIAKEISRIKKLRINGQLDHYMLFANRRLAGNIESEIRKHISVECGITEVSIYLCGIEQLEMFLRRFPDVAKIANFDPIDGPLIVTSYDLAEVVQALAQHKAPIPDTWNDPPVPRMNYEDKNILNNMTPSYAKAQRQKYLTETQQISDFLAAPENQESLQLYNSIVDDFSLKIIAKRREEQTFDNIMEYLADLLFGRDPVLSRHKRLTRAILFHMYWFCDIGEVEDAETD
jgi:hypothetical protein